MRMKDPPHPGLIIKHDCLPAVGLSVTKAANLLGVTRQTLNNVVNGRSGISAEMAIRFAKAFGGGPEIWLRMQADYDLAQAMRTESEIRVDRIPVLPEEIAAP